MGHSALVVSVMLRALPYCVHAESRGNAFPALKGVVFEMVPTMGTFAAGRYDLVFTQKNNENFWILRVRANGGRDPT